MKITIRNIGPVNSAEIDLLGLTVIGGFNDSGKSTVGKTLFALTKSFRNKEQQFNYEQKNKITAYSSELMSKLRGVLGGRFSPQNINMILRRYTNYLLEPEAFDIDNIDVALEAVKSNIYNNIVHRSFIREKELNTPIVDGNKDPIDDALNQYISDLKVVLTSNINEEDLYKGSYGRMLTSVFSREINNKRNIHQLGTISLKNSEDDEEIFYSSFKDNKISDFKIKDSSKFEIFDDCTFLESPFTINKYSTLQSFSPAYRSRDIGDYTTQDLIQKLNLVSNDMEAHQPFESEIIDKISELISGKMYFDSDEDEFVYKTTDGYSFSVNNTASGVKTLGILQMLVNLGLFTGNNLLIIDEPEVHLHPAWQIVYAEIVAMLVKNNLLCLISTHSPYFLKAIQTFVRTYEIENLTKFYIAEKSPDGCNFHDITSDIEPLYELLAEPMQSIIFQNKKAK
ncbi:AAA family ATPase [Hymenobacter fastidiosus]|uniref:AAA family ATPase n=1 Tax=Hymenobacter fastidiosus TaxID=486264 RepID=A0ABP7SNE4_9BACT